MRIALDVTYASPRERYGIGVYSAQLARALARLDRENFYHLCYRPSYLLRGGETLRFQQPNVHTWLLQDPFNWLLARRVDIFHSLNLRLPRQRFRCEVVTLHDVYALTERVYATEEFRRTFGQLTREVVARAQHLIVPSNYLKDEVRRTCGLPEEKISVVPLGVEVNEPAPDAEAISPLQRSIGHTGPLLLAVGSIERRKNLANVARALRVLPEEVRLLQVGGLGFGAEEVLRAIEEAGVRERIIRLGYLPPAEMKKIYCLATLLVFPSLEETFGLPVLEAMAAGLPVVTSNRSALPEVAGEAALLVNPENPEEIAAAVRRILDSPELRRELIRKGHERAREFPWERTARETLAVYERLTHS